MNLFEMSLTFKLFNKKFQENGLGCFYEKTAE